jgi:hypothetical protein
MGTCRGLNDNAAEADKLVSTEDGPFERSKLYCTLSGLMTLSGFMKDAVADDTHLDHVVSDKDELFRSLTEMIVLYPPSPGHESSTIATSTQAQS